ncbi:MAG TPA: ATP-binding protein, partial [Vicinamibacterales bacterium]
METLQQRLRQRDGQRRAMLHIMADLNQSNRRLANQRKAMLHILGDYEQDRRRLAQQRQRLDDSRRALLHILQDSYRDRLRLESGRKAMIHIMEDLRATTAKVEARERELRQKQQQLVQAGKLATIGELATGVAHELNNPLNNVSLLVGNAVDRIRLGITDHARSLREFDEMMQQIRRATEIISHLRTFGRVAPAVYEMISLRQLIERALSLMQEQLRLHQISVILNVSSRGLIVTGNAIQLEQVFINLFTNARDALAGSPTKAIHISALAVGAVAEITFFDTGPGIPAGLQARIFDPFFTTKDVGKGTGLGLSITYGIVKEHGGTIAVSSEPGRGASFLIQLPLAASDGNETIRGMSRR